MGVGIGEAIKELVGKELILEIQGYHYGREGLLATHRTEESHDIF